MNLYKRKYLEKSDGNYFNYNFEKSEWTLNPDIKSIGIDKEIGIS